jgi:hypothetical protein
LYSPESIRQLLTDVGFHDIVIQHMLVTAAKG